MKKYILFLVLSSLLFNACNIYEEDPLDIVKDDDVWGKIDSTGNYAIRYLNGVYLMLPDLHNRIGNDYLDAGTDDAIPSIYKSDRYNVNAFRNGGISARNVVDSVAWSRSYQGIRRANVFLANIDKAALSHSLKDSKKIWKAEVRYLRAFYYFELLKRWGGVPLLGDKILSENDNTDIARSSIQDCCDYILKELDEIESDLYDANGLSDINIGRATNGAALALRSRILLYMASPLYNTENSVQKWKDAADAAKDVIDLGVYNLHSDYKALFYTLKNNETIFLKESAQSTSVETYNSPVGYFSSSYISKGVTSPSQSLIDAFPMKNGKPITDSDSGYDRNTPYENRDPRLGYTVFYNGSQWLGREVQTYEGGSDKPNTNLPQTRTGYYLRKFMGAFEGSSTYSNTHHSFIIFRYAEILLNYAEALNEYNMAANKTAIEDALIRIRSRAGIEAGTDGRYGLPANYTKEEMREIIRNERRIEFAFEEQRFWDIRRWQIAEDVMNQPVEGMRIVKGTNQTYTYNRFEVESSTFDKSKMYWFPIPYHEMLANPKLTQNPGWNF